MAAFLTFGSQNPQVCYTSDKTSISYTTAGILTDDRKKMTAMSPVQLQLGKSFSLTPLFLSHYIVKLLHNG